jgi:NAD(P)-dependent dehydrogenase (short-subunit alcohol dehydrogenase family)
MSRRIAFITGAAGGMGKACARLFAPGHDLVLTDLAEAPLAAFADELAADGHRVRAAHAGDLLEDDLLGRLSGELAGPQPLVAIHAAGMSAAMAGWERLLQVNLVASEKVLRMLELHLRPGSVAVLIASIAGHMYAGDAQADRLLADPLAPDLLQMIAPHVKRVTSERNSNAGTRGTAYCMAKRSIMRMAERRAAAWGARGARIVSISPGMILSPMGRREIVETPSAGGMIEAAPLGRAGSPMEIAQLARFLASDDAGFITGTDVRIDGGLMALVAS